MKTVIVSKNSPRSADALGINFARGYQIEKWLSQFFLFGGSLLILIILTTARSFPSWGIVLFALSSIVMAVWLAYKRIQFIRQTINQRKVTYEKGEPIRFTVVKHSRPFMWQISAKGHGIICQHPETNTSIHINQIADTLWQSCPLGSHIYGFHYQHDSSHHYLFGEMLSVSFQFENEA